MIANLRYPILFILIILSYLPLMHGEFLYDGDLYILNNPIVSEALVFAEFMSHFWTEQLNYIIYRALYLLSGYDTLSFHILNLAIHLANVLLLISLFKKLNLRFGFSMAALYGLSPYSLYTAGWIFQMRSNISILFCLLSFLFFLAFQKRRGLFFLWLSVISFYLSLHAKGTALLFPVMLGAYLVFQKKFKVNKEILVLIPYFLTTCLFGYLTMVGQNQSTETVYDFDGIGSFAQRVILVGKSFWFYIYKIVFPFNLKFIYPFWDLDSNNILSFIPFVMGLVVSFCLLLMKNKEIRNILVLFWVLVSLALFPVLGFFDIGHFKNSYVANHWGQFAFVIILVGMGALLTQLYEKKILSGKKIQLGVLAIVLLFSYKTYRETKHFVSFEAFMKKAIKDNPSHYLGYYNLAVDRMRKKLYSEAIPYYLQSLELHPTHKIASLGLGQAYINVKNYALAKEALRGALKITPNNREVLFELGKVNVNLKNYKQAAKVYLMILNEEPKDWRAWVGLGISYASLGFTERAFVAFNKAKEIEPENKLIESNRQTLLILLEKQKSKAH